MLYLYTIKPNVISSPENNDKELENENIGTLPNIRGDTSPGWNLSRRFSKLVVVVLGFESVMPSFE